MEIYRENNSLDNERSRNLTHIITYDNFRLKSIFTFKKN